MPVVPDHTGIAPSGDTDTPDGRKQTKTQSWPAGAWEWSRKQGAWRRLTLRRSDGRTYLNRWSVTSDRLGGVMLHRMDAPDPGVDLHDHPWWFVSIILWGGYIEERADIRNACARAETVEPSRGDRVTRKWLSARTMRLDECHTITRLRRKTSWSLVIKGPRRRGWGFYLPGGYLDEARYDATVRAERRDLWVDQHLDRRSW